MMKKTLGEPGTRTLGPIPDLERHLPEEWWRGLFNSIYLNGSSELKIMYCGFG